MQQELYSRQKVLALTSMSGPTLWRCIKNGSFPSPVRISANRVAWLSSDVYAWLTALRHTDGSLASAIVAEDSK